MSKESFSVLIRTEKDIKAVIKQCKAQLHFQQVVYSVHGDCYTQICFDCQNIVTNNKF